MACSSGSMAKRALHPSRMTRNQPLSRRGACLFLLAVGCSDARTSDDTPPPVIRETAEPASCTDSLENVLKISPCRATYATATDGPNQLCGSYYDSFQVTTVAAHSFITKLYGAGQLDCVYDVGSSALVGMRVSDDGNYFCNGTSSVVEAGDVGDADWAPETLRTIDCSDSDLPPSLDSPSPTPRACPGGTTPTFLYQTSTYTIGSFALSASDVYWAEPDGIWHAPKAGGTGLPVAEDTYGERVLGSDAEALYWSHPPVWSEPPALFRVPFQGGSAPQRLVGDASHGWTISGSQIYYLASNGQLRSVPTSGGASSLLAEGTWSSEELAADATGIYWYANPAGTAISKYTFTTGAVTDFAPVTGNARYLQIAADRVLWSDAAGIWSSTPSGERTQLSSTTSVRGLSADETHIYWAQSTGSGDVFSDILALPLAGGAAATVACHLYAVRSLRADRGAIYYDSTVGDVVGKIMLQ